MKHCHSDNTERERFYNVNIHERRIAAYVCRAFPLTFVVLLATLSLYGAYTWEPLLLVLSAFFNVATWLWVVSTALASIHAALSKLTNIESCPLTQPNTIQNAGHKALTDNAVVHMIALPNYKEDEAVLADALRSLSEADGSQAFWIILGMEDREGEEGKQKGARLQARFGHQFARLVVCHHPANLVQHHQDGSEDAEVPGKASNMKYVVQEAYKDCLDSGVDPDTVVFTVADADCMLHPFYFSQLGKDFLALRSVGEHQYSMWQAPPFPYRNFWDSPIVSRVWGYLESFGQLGGLGSIGSGGHHLPYSTYSLPLLLAASAEAWDGDIIAEDNHCFLKCFYFSVYQAGRCNSQKQSSKMNAERMAPSLLQLRPIFLPVKSTLVAGEDWRFAWVQTWIQKKRHAQGVAELSYALLATYDALRLGTLRRRRLLSWNLFARMFQAVANPFCVHVLPICQTICFSIVSVKWFMKHRNHESLAMCPTSLSFFGDTTASLWSEERYLLCGLAGAWVLVWPTFVPWCLIVISNFIVMHKVFLVPSESNGSQSMWHAEDGHMPQKHARCKLIGLILVDCLFGMSWIVFLYGFVVELLAYVHVMVYGNHITYIPAPKLVASRAGKAPVIDYGAVHHSVGMGREADDQ